MFVVSILYLICSRVIGMWSASGSRFYLLVIILVLELPLLVQLITRGRKNGFYPRIILKE